jgi:RND family efflux transporter MFP subunit
LLKLSHIARLGSIIVALLAMNASPAAGTDSVELDGLIEPYLIVKVGSPVAGILKAVEVDRGDLVTKGQLLATLQSEVEKATMALARARAGMESSINAKQARLKFSLRKQDRMEALYGKKVIPFEEMDESRTNSALALMELAEARENKRLAELEYKRSLEVVNRMAIRSPIKGVVMERFLTPGEYVEDQPILKLAQIDPLNVEVFVPVELFGAIKVGMSAEVTPENPLSRAYKAKVKIVDRVVDAASGTFGVRLELPNPENRLPAGLKCKVTFLVK